MTTIARFRTQRRVTRGAWRARFTHQKLNSRGSSTFTTPTLTSISPTTAVHGAANATLTATGTGFTPPYQYTLDDTGNLAATIMSQDENTPPAMSVPMIAASRQPKRSRRWT